MAVTDKSVASSSLEMRETLSCRLCQEESQGLEMQPVGEAAQLAS